jgi:hypothetical protein
VHHILESARLRALSLILLQVCFLFGCELAEYSGVASDLGKVLGTPVRAMGMGGGITVSVSPDGLQGVSEKEKTARFKRAAVLSFQKLGYRIKSDSGPKPESEWEVEFSIDLRPGQKENERYRFRKTPSGVELIFHKKPTQALSPSPD